MEEPHPVEEVHGWAWVKVEVDWRSESSTVIIALAPSATWQKSCEVNQEYFEQAASHSCCNAPIRMLQAHTMCLLNVTCSLCAASSWRRLSLVISMALLRKSDTWSRM
ncbi:hypothetical protein QOT17_011080 [Balamuthia mandrillaris]